MNTAFIALGTNIEPRETYLNDAINLLKAHDRIAINNKSSIYVTAPVGYTDQEDFLNMVISIDTDLSSIELLDYCQEIERDLGRKRTIRFGPRTIDLDILVYNQENRQTDRLIIPHPRMCERAFVLIPLGEIAPKLMVPIVEKQVIDIIADLSSEDIAGVRRLV